MNSIDLNNILAGCRKRKPGSQKDLYQYSFTPMLKVCLRYTQNRDEAASFYNAAMYKVFVNIDQFKNEGEFLGWIRRIVVNTCISMLKQNARYEYKELDTTTEHDFSTTPDIYQQLNTKEILEMVQELPPNMKLVFNLFVMEAYTHEKIGELLGISKGTSKWYLHEARKQLKEKIKGLLNYEITSNAK